MAASEEEDPGGPKQIVVRGLSPYVREYLARIYSYPWVRFVEKNDDR